MAEQHYHHICSVLVALREHFVDMAVSSPSEPFEVRVRVGDVFFRQGVVRCLVAVHHVHARGDPAVLICPIRVENELRHECFDVSGAAPHAARVDDEDVDLAPAVLCRRRCPLGRQARLVRITVRDDEIRLDFRRLAKIRGVVVVHRGEAVAQGLHAVDLAVVMYGPGHVLSNHHKGGRRRRVLIARVQGVARVQGFDDQVVERQGLLGPRQLDRQRTSLNHGFRRCMPDAHGQYSRITEDLVKGIGLGPGDFVAGLRRHRQILDQHWPFLRAGRRQCSEGEDARHQGMRRAADRPALQRLRSIRELLSLRCVHGRSLQFGNRNRARRHLRSSVRYT